MLASDVWIEKLATLSHKDATCSDGPLSSEDVAVVVDSHCFTDCHLEAMFNMNTSRLQLRSTITIDGKDARLIAGVSPWTRLSVIFFRTVNHNCLIYQNSYNDFFEVCITETVTLSPNIQIWCYHQFNSTNQSHVTNRSLSSLIKIAFSWYPLW